MQYFQPEVLFLAACFLIAYLCVVIGDLFYKFAGAVTQKMKMKNHAVA